MKTDKHIIALLTLCMVAVLLISGCTTADTSKMKVVTSTSLWAILPIRWAAIWWK